MERATIYGNVGVVLPGGGILGAKQAGALKSFETLILRGIIPRPKWVVGISVGSLNGALACQHNNFSAPFAIWRDRVKSPDNLVKGKSLWFRVLPGLLRSKFDGLYSVEPLQKLVDSYIDVKKLRLSKMELSVGAVNLSNGELVYATPTFSNFTDYLMASSSIPIVMPTVPIEKSSYVDGGLISLAPVTKAIRLGASTIFVFPCHPLGQKSVVFDPRDPVSLATRFMDIITANNLERDLDGVNKVNRRIREIESFASLSEYAKDQVMIKAGLSSKKEVTVHVISPESGEDDIDIGNFPRGKITDMLDDGLAYAQKYFKSQGWLT